MLTIECDMSKYIPVHRSWRVRNKYRTVTVEMNYYEKHLNGTRTYHGCVGGDNVKCTYDGSKAYAERKFRELLTETARNQQEMS